MSACICSAIMLHKNIKLVQLSHFANGNLFHIYLTPTNSIYLAEKTSAELLSNKSELNWQFWLRSIYVAPSPALWWWPHVCGAGDLISVDPPDQLRENPIHDKDPNKDSPNLWDEPNCCIMFFVSEWNIIMFCITSPVIIRLLTTNLSCSLT